MESSAKKPNNVKARNVQGQQVDLTPLPNNMWSLQNLVSGVYLLDVIVDMSSSGILGVYETVLVILQPDQTPLPPSTVINQLSIFIDDNDTSPSPSPNITALPSPNITALPSPNITTPIPGPPEPPGSEPPDNETDPIVCPLNAEGIRVCPPTDEPSPIPGPPTPQCPEAGPDVCDEEPAPPPEEPPDSNGNGNGNGDSNGNGNDNGNGDGQDGSNGDGDDNEGSEEIPTVPFG
jgi:hypothetical protein